MSCRLKVSPTSGALAPDATQSVTLIFIMPSTRGTHSTNLQLTALGPSNSPVTVPVSVTMKESPLTITALPIPTVSGSPTGITRGPDGNLWFTESNGNMIRGITPL